MALDTRLDDLITAIGTDWKANMTNMFGSLSGSLSDLVTTDKTSLVAAINEARENGGGAPANASETAAGIAELATQAETNAGTDDARIVTPLKFVTKLAAYAQPLSTNLTSLAAVASGTFGRTLLGTTDASGAKSALGLASVASSGSAADLTGMLPASSVPTASESAVGGAEIATQSETNAGADDSRMITPLKMATRLVAYAQPLAANLTSLATVAPGAFGKTLLGSANAAAATTSLGLAAVATSGSASDITTGTLPTSVLPSLAISEFFPAASEAAMLALNAQQGDVASRSDLDGRFFWLTSNSPTTLADWKPIQAVGEVSQVAGKVGNVVLVKDDVGLSNVDNTADSAKPVSTATQTALDAKLAKASNLSDLTDLATARTNLSVYSQAEIGDPDTDLVALYTAAKA